MLVRGSDVAVLLGVSPITEKVVLRAVRLEHPDAPLSLVTRVTESLDAQVRWAE